MAASRVDRVPPSVWVLLCAYRGIGDAMPRESRDTRRSSGLRARISDQRWPLLIVTVAAGACGATLDQLQSRAALDLDCHPKAISSRELDDQTRIASGCGKQAIYVETCTSPNHSGCTWLLNSSIRPFSADAK